MTRKKLCIYLLLVNISNYMFCLSRMRQGKKFVTNKICHSSNTYIQQLPSSKNTKVPKRAEFSDMNTVQIEVFICIVIIRIDILLNHTDIYLHLIISFYTFSDIYVCVYVL